MDLNSIHEESNQMVQTAIPDLIKLLLDDDLVIVQQASILLAQMSRIEVLRSSLIQTENACQCIVNCLNTTADLETARNLLSTLYGISIDKNIGIPAILRSSALDPLIKILNAPMDILVSFALASLHNILLLNDHRVKNKIRQLGGISQLIIVLNKSDDLKFLTVLIDCLYILTYQDLESKKFIYDIGGTQTLMSAFSNRVFLYQKFDICFLKLLKSLSVYQPNKVVMINLGILDKLEMFLMNQNINDCLQLLKNLSDQASFLTNLKNLITNLFNLITDPLLSLSNKREILCILSNLTCNNENNKCLLIDLNIILSIIGFLNEPELIEPSLWIMKNLINRNPKSLLAQEQILNFALPHFSELILHMKYSKSILILLKSMFKFERNFDQIRKYNILDKIIIKLAHSDSSLEDIELCSSCLLFISKDINSKIYLKKSLYIFKQMMVSDITRIRNIGFALYSEFSV